MKIIDHRELEGERVDIVALLSWNRGDIVALLLLNPGSHCEVNRNKEKRIPLFLLVSNFEL